MKRAGQKNERGKTVVSKKKVAIILAVATLSLATVSLQKIMYRLESWTA